MFWRKKDRQRIPVLGCCEAWFIDNSHPEMIKMLANEPISLATLRYLPLFL